MSPGHRRKQASTALAHAIGQPAAQLCPAVLSWLAGANVVVAAKCQVAGPGTNKSGAVRRLHLRDGADDNRRSLPGAALALLRLAADTDIVDGLPRDPHH